MSIPRESAHKISKYDERKGSVRLADVRPGRPVYGEKTTKCTCQIVIRCSGAARR